jgi:hypothetical protein
VVIRGRDGLKRQLVPGICCSDVAPARSSDSTGHVRDTDAV